MAGWMDGWLEAGSWLCWHLHAVTMPESLEGPLGSRWFGVLGRYGIDVGLCGVLRMMTN
tara:strand:+ start:496 stop:672 length:177 start_codon:yes stop_codon:yes gene_type:complete